MKTTTAKCLSLFIATCTVPFAAHAAEKSIIDTAVSAGQFTTLVSAVKAANLVDALSGDGPFTVFAPTDAAFAKLPAGTVEALIADPDKLSAILTYHVVPGKVMASDVAGLNETQTLLGQPAAIDTSNGVSIANAKVIKTDIACSNGVIHVIDSVMMPKNIVDIAAGEGSFSTLLKAAEAAGLVDTLANGGPFTVFAPTDAAFAALPEGTIATLLKPENKDQLVKVLTYHVVPGKVLAADVVALTKADTVAGVPLPIEVKTNADGSVKAVHVGAATVTATDIIASNGVIHIIDAVLIPHE